MRIVPVAAPMTREGTRDLVGGAAPMICMAPMFGRTARDGHEPSGSRTPATGPRTTPIPTQPPARGATGAPLIPRGRAGPITPVGAPGP